jgi:arabinofuranosyltransferase
MQPNRIDRRVASLLWLLLFVVVLRNSWLSEDAYITYRVVDNFVHGYGLRWNPLERVQVYTHPLWMLILLPLHWALADIYTSATLLSLACSGLAAYLLLFRGLRSDTWPCVLAAALAICSKAFIDYSTSGLENPLSHLFLALFFVEYLKERSRRSLARMVVWAGLLLVNRLDLVWLVLPALVHEAWARRAWHPRRWLVWLGFLPLVAWEVFSVLYYGFLFPNSAYAKLTVHIGFKNLLAQGFCYFANSLAWDPLTLAAIAALCLLGLRRSWRDPQAGFVALGVLSYLAYVVRVGGDYMSGRFFTAPFFVALFVLSRAELEGVVQPLVALGTALVLGLTSPRPPLFSTDTYQGLGHSVSLIDDERGYRFGDTSLLLVNREHSLADRGGWVADGIHARENHERVTVYKNIGYFGFFAGPTVHIIDPYGIGDALLARMPFTETMGGWAPGHFMRKVPDGYEKAALGEGTIADPNVQAYWEKLELVTRGRIFDKRRLGLILRFNLGLEKAPKPSSVDLAYEGGQGAKLAMAAE